jgi:hypothetical protein
VRNPGIDIHSETALHSVGGTGRLGGCVFQARQQGRDLGMEVAAFVGERHRARGPVEQSALAAIVWTLKTPKR